MSRRIDPDDVHDLVRGCTSGDGAARRAFQERYGKDIYNFPVKIYGVPADRAADFYVYVFERDRIFTRMRTFEGRNGIQFRTFLAYYVLRSLFLEWQRGNRELDTVSLNEDGGPGSRAEDGDEAPASTPVARWRTRSLFGNLSSGPEAALALGAPAHARRCPSAREGLASITAGHDCAPRRGGGGAARAGCGARQVA